MQPAGVLGARGRIGTVGRDAEFLGEDVNSATRCRRVSFWLHLDSWPLVTDRSEGSWSIFVHIPGLQSLAADEGIFALKILAKF